jgi:hypothetical protein
VQEFLEKRRVVPLAACAFSGGFPSLRVIHGVRDWVPEILATAAMACKHNSRCFNSSSNGLVVGHFDVSGIDDPLFLSPSRVAAARRVPDSGIPRAPGKTDAREWQRKRQTDPVPTVLAEM